MKPFERANWMLALHDVPLTDDQRHELLDRLDRSGFKGDRLGTALFGARIALLVADAGKTFEAP